jgi:hypothetical protein
MLLSPFPIRIREFRLPCMSKPRGFATPCDGGCHSLANSHQLGWHEGSYFHHLYMSYAKPRRRLKSNRFAISMDGAVRFVIALRRNSQILKLSTLTFVAVDILSTHRNSFRRVQELHERRRQPEPRQPACYLGAIIRPDSCSHIVICSKTRRFQYRSRENRSFNQQSLIPCFGTSC